MVSYRRKPRLRSRSLASQRAWDGEPRFLDDDAELPCHLQLMHSPTQSCCRLGAARWLLALPSRPRAASQQRTRSLRSASVVTYVDELTTRVATDVGTHSIQVKKINDELTSNESAGSAAIVATVAKLVAVNEHMQRRLAEAEAKLQEQSRALAAPDREARTDALTRLPNRRALDDEISHAVRRVPATWHAILRHSAGRRSFQAT